jgi:hypothetical protein
MVLETPSISAMSSNLGQKSWYDCHRSHSQTYVRSSELADSVLHSFVARIYSSHTLLLPAVSARLQLQVQGLFTVATY